jgi:Tfp pilus assembly protein PilF
MTPVSPAIARRRLVSAVLVASLWVAMTIHPAAAAKSPEEWFKLVSPNFVLYSNSRDGEAGRLLRELETFRHVVSRFLALTNVQRRPALVYYFADDQSFHAFKPRFGDQPRPLSGFHVTDPSADALAVSRSTRGGAARRVLFHEYIHLLTARQFRHAPLWAKEGVAEIFSTFERVKDRFDIGVAMTNHVFYLRDNGIMDLPALLAVTHESPDYNEASRAGRFYATSWLLAHYVTFGRGGFQTNVLARYAALCSGTTNQVQAFRAAFGVTAADLTDGLEQYLRAGVYTIVRQTYPDLDDVRPARVRLEPAELDFALGRLLQLVDHPEAARKRLERAAAAAPMDPRPAEAMALLAWREGDGPRTRRHVEDALRHDSRDAFVHFLAADICYQDLAQPTLPAVRRRQLLSQGRRWVERSVELDPGLAPAHHLLGVYVHSGNRGSPVLAMAHIEQALRCDPQYKPALLTLASLFAAQGDFARAQSVLGGLMAGPLPPNLREVAQRVASEIEDAGRTARQ